MATGSTFYRQGVSALAVGLRTNAFRPALHQQYYPS
jgi:hypothetical protein